MTTRIKSFPKKDGKRWYKAQRKFLGMWVDHFAHPTRWFRFTTYESTSKEDIINVLILVKG